MSVFMKRLTQITGLTSVVVMSNFHSLALSLFSSFPLPAPQWYKCSPDLLGEVVRPLFVQSHLDQDTQAFLRRSIEKSGWMFTQFYHSFISTVLSPLVSRTSING